MNWYSNRTRKEKEQTFPFVRGNVTFNTVFIYLWSDQIAKAVDKAASNAKRGSRKWLSFYTPTLKDTRAKLTDKEVAAINKVKDEWQTKGAPEEIQAK